MKGLQPENRSTRTARPLPLMRYYVGREPAKQVVQPARAQGQCREGSRRATERPSRLARNQGIREEPTDIASSQTGAPDTVLNKNFARPIGQAREGRRVLLKDTPTGWGTGQHSIQNSQPREQATVKDTLKPIWHTLDKNGNTEASRTVSTCRMHHHASPTRSKISRNRQNFRTGTAPGPSPFPPSQPSGNR